MLLSWLRRLHRDTRGQDLSEYALLGGMLALIVVIGLISLGSSINFTFGGVESGISGKPSFGGGAGSGGGSSGGGSGSGTLPGGGSGGSGGGGSTPGGGGSTGPGGGGAGGTGGTDDGNDGKINPGAGSGS